MYNVYNKSDVYYLWNISKQKEYLIGDENDLIHMIAKNYRPSWGFWDWDDSHNLHCGHWANSILNSFACNVNEADKQYQIFDGYGRCINPKIYEREAFQLFLSKYKDKKQKYYWSKYNNYKYIYRYDPIRYTGKRSGGPSVRPRRIMPAKRMYANPEYKEFNRGSHKDLPDGWWDDWYRHREKNWKKHRKHQWKEKKE